MSANYDFGFIFMYIYQNSSFDVTKYDVRSKEKHILHKAGLLNPAKSQIIVTVANKL